MRFSEKKAAQVAAFFLSRAGGSMEILKLMKLMYLAERASFRRYGEPMIGDKLYSMEHGPVLSATLDHMNNFVDSEPGGWESWISSRQDHFLGLRRDVQDPRQELTQLSDADLEILAEVWQQHGHLSGGQLRNLAHKICTEWEDPNYSSIPIPYSRILKCVGYDADVAAELEHRIIAQRRLEMILEGADW
jgi:uncharacterized phage-associated protein